MKKILIAVIILIIGFGAGYGLHSYLTKDWAETGTTLMERDHIGQLSYDVWGYRHQNNHESDTFDEEGHIIGKGYCDFNTLNSFRILRISKSKKSLEQAQGEFKNSEIQFNAEIPDFVDDAFCWGVNPTDYEEGFTLYGQTNVIVRIGDYDYYISTTDPNDTMLPGIVESMELDKSLKDEIVKI